ncbi:MAG: ferredoxin [Candidatus Aceula meridiana]|nr:ferredoxin [Candidatus Aceula meridiana]
MKAVVDKQTCTGCELCVQTCPEVFKMEDDKAVAFVDSVSAEVEGSCQEAADGCPVTAIKIEK